MRESSNSITHLVKIVAREVCEDVFEEKRKTITHRIDITKMENSFCENIQTSLEETGNPWYKEEDILLREEIKTAVAQIAKNHKRSECAITSRIQQKSLFF